jgi:NitT/TauT family transport system ATP-binding protein
MSNIKGISLKNVKFSYPGQNSGDERLQIFNDFSMEIPEAKVSVILGPSGCGKTTLLNLISGLLEADSGLISTRNNGGRPDISLLFQEPRLLPWKTIRTNLEIVLRRSLGKAEGSRTAANYLNLVGLTDFADYYPADLSGGMRQRAAIARAFAYPAGMILMDEPFQALDLGLKLALTALFAKLWIKDSRTAVFVTHDINEAILLGDEVFVLSADKPSGIIEHISNDVPHPQRRLDSPLSISIEKRLYHLLAV